MPKTAKFYKYLNETEFSLRKMKTTNQFHLFEYKNTISCCGNVDLGETSGHEFKNLIETLARKACADHSNPRDICGICVSHLYSESE